MKTRIKVIAGCFFVSYLLIFGYFHIFVNPDNSWLKYKLLHIVPIAFNLVKGGVEELSCRLQGKHYLHCVDEFYSENICSEKETCGRSIMMERDYIEFGRGLRKNNN